MKLIFRILVNFLVVLSIPVMLLGGLTAAKITAPLIVISGSMEPTISVGSLVVSSTVKAEDLHVGEIASLKREDGVLVTHRIVENSPTDGNEALRTIKMKGDANSAEDQKPYIQQEALKPLFVIPVVGSWLAAIGNHKYAILSVFSFGFGIYLLFKLIFGKKEDHTKRGRRSAKNATDEEENSNQE